MFLTIWRIVSVFCRLDKLLLLLASSMPPECLVLELICQAVGEKELKLNHFDVHRYIDR